MANKVFMMRRVLVVFLWACSACADDRVLKYIGDCSPSKPCDVCVGGCDNDSDCKPGLKCYVRDGNNNVPGCEGSGVKGKDYCHEPPLKYVGECNSKARCGLCEGDCDDENDCEGDLVCFQRDKQERIPGCIGSGRFGKDYCYLPPRSGSDLDLIRQCSPSAKCGLCEGGCDTSDDCEDGLVCFKRDDQENVPGCGGGEKGKNLCFRPTVQQLRVRGHRKCSPFQNCEACEGDCDENMDCKGDLKCFQRHGFEGVPGCEGRGEIGIGYCYVASKENEPPNDIMSVVKKLPVAEDLQPREPLSYRPGHLVVKQNGLLLSQGLSSRQIARKDRRVQYRNGEKSKELFHKMPDGAAVFSKPDGGWIYVSNSEVRHKQGGVGAIEFDRDGEVIGYRMIAKNTSMNCGGGATWWGTYLSCEEEKNGHIWEVDPTGKAPKRRTLIGGADGGVFESAAFDNRDRTHPRFYVTEDTKAGPLRRFSPERFMVFASNRFNDYSHLLYTNATGTAKIEYLLLLPESENHGKFEWTQNKRLAKRSAKLYYPYSEGIDRSRNLLYVTAKKPKIMLILDLDAQTYERQSTKSGAFNNQPDQIKVMLGDDKSQDLVYFCEDGGHDSGVHARDSSGRFYSILDGPDYKSETTGLDFSPDRRRMYVAFQQVGRIFEITRDDGLPFGGRRLDIKYHAA